MKWKQETSQSLVMEVVTSFLMFGSIIGIDGLSQRTAGPEHCKFFLTPFLDKRTHSIQLSFQVNVKTQGISVGE